MWEVSLLLTTAKLREIIVLNAAAAPARSVADWEASADIDYSVLRVARGHRGEEERVDA